MNNVMEEYILFTKKCLHKYIKLIYDVKYDRKIATQYIDAYVNVRYSNYIDEETKTLTLSKKISYVLDDAMKDMICNFPKNKEIIITTLRKFANYFFSLDQLYLLESQKKAIEKINLGRRRFFKIEEEDNFVNEFYTMLREDIKTRKEYIDNFASNLFFINLKKINKNEYFSQLDNKIVFPEIYSKEAIKKVAERDTICEDLTSINFFQVTTTIIKDLVGCNFAKTYYSYLPETFFDKKIKLSRIFKIIDSPFVQERFNVVITYKCFMRYKSYVREYMRQGFTFALYLDSSFEYSSENTELLELFNKIFIDSGKYYYKDMKKSVKIKDRIVNIDEVK